MRNANTGSFASRNETISYAATAGVVYDLNNIALNTLPVNSQLAKFYQYYRITSVQWRLKPNYDTFSTAGNTVLPYLYFLFDKAGSLGNLTAPQFEQCGAIPQRVDDKILTRRWKPAVLMNAGQTLTGQFKTSPWMPTMDPTGTTLNSPNHGGAVFYVSKMNANDVTVYDVDITITVQYRKPLVQVASSHQAQPLIQISAPAEQ